MKTVIGYPSGQIFKFDDETFNELLNGGTIKHDDEWTPETPNGQYSIDDSLDSEFQDLLNSDPEFNYDENEFGEWLKDYVNNPRPAEYTEEQTKLREILIKYGNEEHGDCILDEICDLFGHPLTPAE